MKKGTLYLAVFLLFLLWITFQQEQDSRFINQPPMGEFIWNLNDRYIYYHDSHWMYTYSTSLVEDTLQLINHDLIKNDLHLTEMSTIKIRFKYHPDVLIRENEVNPVSATIDHRGIISVYPRYTNDSISFPAAYRTFIHEIGHLVFTRLFYQEDHPLIKEYMLWRKADVTKQVWDHSLHEIFAEDFKTVFTPAERLSQFQDSYPEIDIPLLFKDFTDTPILDNEMRKKFREMLIREIYNKKSNRSFSSLPTFPPLNGTQRLLNYAR